MKKEYSTLQLARDIYKYLGSSRGSFILASFIRVLGDIAWLYPAYGTAELINYLTKYHTGQSLNPVFLVFVFLVASTITRFLTGYIAKMIMFGISEKMALNIQMAAMTHMFDLDIAWHEAESTGNKLKKINRGADSADRVLRFWINNYLPIAINFIGITLVIARFDKAIALFTIIFVVTYYAYARIVRKRAAQATIISNQREEEMEGTLFESLNNIRSIKVLGMAPALKKILLKDADVLYQAILKRIFWFQLGGYTRGFYAQLFQIAILSYVVYGILHGHYEVGFLVLFTGYFNTLLQAVSELADVTQDFVVAQLSVGRMVEILDVPINIDRTDGKVAFPHDWKKITLKNVSFGYGDSLVLKDVSFEIERGEKIGIIGLSGAGKSTIFKLLLKEHESYTGEILFDDTPLSSVSRQDYFKYAAVVLQDTEVFNLSLRDNIVLTNNDESANEELLEKALRVAHVQDFVSRLPKGIESMIGEKGVRLSGGERQRVGIARAVFKNPQLLLLDEATSHLDIESEEKIKSSLHEFFQSVTAIVVAHRLTTIREMDRVIVIEGGKILEIGTFDDLYAAQGRFYELWEKQTL